MISSLELWIQSSFPLPQIIFRFMYKITATTFLSPLQSNDLSKAEKKLARDQEETKKLDTFEQAAEENEDTHQAEEMQEEAVYIPGAGRLGRLKNRDLRRLNKEEEFETRFVSFQS